MVLLLNIAFPIWGVGAAPRGCFPPADGEEAALPPGRQELNPSVLDALGTCGAGPDLHPRPGGAWHQRGGEREAVAPGCQHLSPTPANQQHNAHCIPWNK